jgi:hypothetical protein
MGKFKILFIILLLFSTNMKAQQNRIVPKSGTIVFVKQEIIIDKDLYLKSSKDIIPKAKKAMEKQLFLERLTDGIKTDTIALKAEIDKVSQLYEIMLPMMIDEPKEIIKFHHKFKGDTIINYISKEYENYINKKFINQVSNMITNENKEYVNVEVNEIIKLTEFKKVIKIINGLKCFKVIYSFNYQNEASTFDFFSEVITNIRELWVTEEIKCNYHPIINEKVILEKYYPLEILEYSNEIKGFKTTYSIEKLDLK